MASSPGYTRHQVALATVTETEILRGQVKDLQADVDALDRRIAEANELVTKAALLLYTQQDEVAALRRQVVALRDGAILEDKP